MEKSQAGRLDVVVVGGGRMGCALVHGLVANGIDPRRISVAEIDERRRKEISSQLGGVAVSDEVPDVESAILAVKPQDAEAAAKAVAAHGARRVLSIMAGVRCAALEAWMGPGVAVVRSMPNTPALLGAGISAVSGGTTAGESELAWAEGLLGAVGEVVRVPERSLDAVTGLSGSGPAYLFLVAEALVEAGVLAGLARTVSERLAIATFSGAARMLAESGDKPETLRAQVTSPGGTTAAGLRVLEERAVRSALLEAVVAASRRSAELAS